MYSPTKKKTVHTFSVLLVLLMVGGKKRGSASCSCAAIAQLGERQTDDLEALSSILGLGSRCTPALSKGPRSATLHYPFAGATLPNISAAGN